MRKRRTQRDQQNYSEGANDGPIFNNQDFNFLDIKSFIFWNTYDEAQYGATIAKKIMSQKPIVNIAKKAKKPRYC